MYNDFFLHSVCYKDIAMDHVTKPWQGFSCTMGWKIDRQRGYKINIERISQRKYSALTE